MKKIVFLIFTLLISYSVLAQNRDIESDYYAEELTDIEINEILNFPISNLSENKSTTELRKKLNSDLNTVASVMVHYKFSKTLKLTSEEQSELEKRMIEIADKFVELNKFVLFKLTGGYSPVFGIKEEIISDKKVLILMLGGDCVTNEMEIKQEKIYKLFNDQMTESIVE